MSLRDIFPVKENVKPGILKRFSAKHNKHNAIVELNNLLSKYETLQEVNIESVESIAAVYKVNLQRMFHYELKWFYKTFLLHCFEDRKLDEYERDALKHLKFILGLRQADVKAIHEEVSLAVYNESVNDVIADGMIDEKERVFLKSLREELMIPDELANKILVESAKLFFARKYDEAVLDERITPEEMAELQSITKSLGVSLPKQSPKRDLLNKYKLYWMIENGELPSVDLGIELEDFEKGYMSFKTDWYDYLIPEKMSVSGETPIKAKIASMDFLSDEKTDFKEVSDERLKHYDKGILHVTDKRLLFRGEKDHADYYAENFVDFNLFKNGIEVQVGSTQCVFFENSNNAEMIAFLFGRVVRDLE